MPYSAVSQPCPLPLRNAGTPSSTLAVHSTVRVADLDQHRAFGVLGEAAGDAQRAQLVGAAAGGTRGHRGALEEMDAGDYSGVADRPVVTARAAAPPARGRGETLVQRRTAAASRSPRGTRVASTSSEPVSRRDRVAAPGEPRPRARSSGDGHRGSSRGRDAQRARRSRGTRSGAATGGASATKWTPAGAHRRVEQPRRWRWRDCRRRAGCAGSSMRAERQRRAAARPRRSAAQEIGPHARPVDQRQAQHDRGAVAVPAATRGQRALGRALASARTRPPAPAVVGPERPAGRRRLAVDLDRCSRTRSARRPPRTAARASRAVASTLAPRIRARPDRPRSRASRARARRGGRSPPAPATSASSAASVAPREVAAGRADCARRRARRRRSARTTARNGRPVAAPVRAQRAADEAVGAGDDDRSRASPARSEPSPAVLAVEAHAALHEPADVREALARRAAAVMDDAKRRQPTRSASPWRGARSSRSPRNRGRTADRSRR